MLNAPVKPKIIGQYEEPIRENYTDNVYLDIHSHSCTINEFRELIRKERLQRKNRTGFYWRVVGTEFIVPSV
jgi:hypothetical protein